MRITTKSRYAVRAVYALLLMGGDKDPVSLKKIAEYETISLKYLEQIFSTLKKHGIVDSVRGTYGGYVLSKDLRDISVKDIIYAMDGPVKPVDCIDRSKCEKYDDCSVNWLWDGLKNIVDNYLEKISLDKMINKKSGESNADIFG
jgi:Rrf2 family protein